MRSLLRVIICFSLAALFGAAHSPEALARPGYTGYTNKTNPAGCSCHGSKSATVTISGPASLSAGTPGRYTVTLSGSSKTGTNVAASRGTLAGVTPEFTVSGGELTITGARNSNTWTFDYTPSIAGVETLYAAGITNGIQGPWNHAAKFPVTVSTATSVAGETPASFSLDQNYPNPFNPSTAIGYTLARPGRVALDVYDLSGNRVATLVDREQDAGSYRVTFDGSGLASGVYLYRLSAGDFTAARKFVLLK